MTNVTYNQAIENIYTSLHSGNQNLDAHIAQLKEILKAEGKKEAVFEPKRLVQNNRQGRKMMESYFKKRGVAVAFNEV